MVGYLKAKFFLLSSQAYGELSLASHSICKPYSGLSSFVNDIVIEVSSGVWKKKEKIEILDKIKK